MNQKTDTAKKAIRTREDLPPGHWMARQLPCGASLRGYTEERAVALLTQAAQQAIDSAGVTRSEAAKLLGTSRSHVTQVLNGSANMTLKTLGALLWVGGQQVATLRTEPVGALQQHKHPNTRTLRLPFTTNDESEEVVVVRPNVRKTG